MKQFITKNPDDFKIFQTTISNNGLFVYFDSIYKEDEDDMYPYLFNYMVIRYNEYGCEQSYTTIDGNYYLGISENEFNINIIGTEVYNDYLSHWSN